MTDITPDINVILKGREAPPILPLRYSIDRLDEFLKEAYSINARITDLTSYLRAIRPSYLSTASSTTRRTQPSSKTDTTRPLTDTDRASIDAESKLLLQRLHSQISQISSAEKLRHETHLSISAQKTSRSGLGGLARWAAGGAVPERSADEEVAGQKEMTVSAHREGVLVFLQRRLEVAGALQTGMMEIRLVREEEKAKSVSYLTRGRVPYERYEGGEGDGGGGGAARGDKEWDEGGLSAEQLQVFQEENRDMFKHYNDQLGQVREVHRSLEEISEMQTTLAANLEMQSAHIDQLTQDSYLTTENIGRGNKELKRAGERPSTARMAFHATCAFCTFLVVWDLIF